MTAAATWAADRLGYRFRDPALLVLALTHRSAAPAHNERLEFLGDAVLGLVAADLLYAARPGASEGTLSRLRARLVRRETLEELARDLDLGQHVLLGSGELRSGGFQRGSILANALEALFGAVYLDGGLDESSRVIRALLEPRLAELPVDEELRDPKSRLQEYLQGLGHPLPVYAVDQQTGAPHDQQFEVVCRVDHAGIVTTGSGPSRRAAEQDAALKALEKLHHDG